MCKNHGYRHHSPTLVRVAALLCKDDLEAMETCLNAATCVGLDEIRRGLTGIVPEEVMAECLSLLAAEKRALRARALQAQKAVIESWGGEVLLTIDDPPF